MRYLLVENGSPYFAAITATFGAPTQLLGYPFLAEDFSRACAGVDAVVISAGLVPSGLTVQLSSASEHAIRACTCPVLAIGRAGALLLSADGRVKETGSGWEIKKAPDGWQHEGGVWHRSLMTALLPDGEVREEDLRAWQNSISSR